MAADPILVRLAPCALARRLGFLLAALLATSAEAESPTTNPCAWSFRRKLTFDNSAQTQPLREFPVLVVLTPGRIDYGRLVDGGTDLRFVDADGGELPYEVERWDPTSRSYVWVRVPRVDGASSSDFIWMYYGNPRASVPSSDAGSVWSEDFVAVWHLSEDPGPGGPREIKDSTPHQNHGTAHASMTSGNLVVGRVGGCVELDGVDDQVSLPDPGGAWELLDGGLNAGRSEFTLSALVLEHPAATESFPSFVYKGGGASFNSGYWFGTERATDSIRLAISDGTNRFIANGSPDAGLSLGQWRHLAAVFRRSVSDTVDFFLDGEPFGQESSSLIAGNSVSSPGQLMVLGTSGSSSQPRAWMGKLDEVRISRVARSADWVRAEHLTVTDTFLGLGSEEPAAPPGTCSPDGGANADGGTDGGGTDGGGTDGGGTDGGGTDDGGTDDGGTDDGGGSADAGGRTWVPARSLRVGCDCSSSPGALLMALLGCLRIRQRRGSPPLGQSRPTGGAGSPRPSCP